MINIHRRGARVSGIVVVAAMILAACSTEEPYHKPVFGFAKSYSLTRNAVPAFQAEDRWWQDFKDPTLDALIERSLSGNIDLAIAREKVIEARANIDTVSGPLSVTPSGSAEVQRQVGTPTTTRVDSLVSFSWLIDPYGLRRQQLTVAGAQSEAANAEVDAARLTLMLNTASTYVDLRYAQKLLELRRQQLRSRRQASALTQRLSEGGRATRLDVIRANALVAETQAQIPSLEAEVRARKNEIAVLAGVAPGELDINLDARGRQPRPQKAPDLGIPADLLRNRPDLQIAELNYYAAVTEIGVARASLYPRLSLGGMIGQALVGGVPGVEFLFGPAIEMPSLLAKERKATVAIRHSRAEQAHAQWKAMVLNALQDVESASAAYGGGVSSVQEAQRHAQLQREARSLTLDLVERERATIRELIDAEAKIAEADVVLAEHLRKLAQEFVRLHVSLGAGSWVGRAADDPVMTPADLMQAMAGG